MQRLYCERKIWNYFWKRNAQQSLSLGFPE